MSSPQPPDNPNPYGQPGYGQPGYGQQPPPGYGQPPPPGYSSPPAAPAYDAPAPQGYGPPPQAGYGAPGYGAQPGNPYAQQYAASFQKPTGWFVVNWLFFWPLAIYSLTSAWGNIDRALFAGDLAGAQYHAGRVKKFGIIALCVGLALTILWIIIAVAVGSSNASYCTGYGC